MKEQFVESEAAWFLLGLALGICIAFFFNIILSLKNREINDLKKQIRGFEMINFENEIKMFRENLNEAMLQKKAFEERVNSLQEKVNTSLLKEECKSTYAKEKI